jgi:hypothetical protein
LHLFVFSMLQLTFESNIQQLHLKNICKYRHIRMLIQKNVLISGFDCKTMLPCECFIR